jgi:esterase/lipase
MPKKRAVVFVHGFLGSEESFDSFPTHLKSHLDVDTLVYPKYTTEGNYEKQVYKLMGSVI